MKLRSISVCNKALLWGKTNADWLGLAPQWVGLAPQWVGLAHQWVGLAPQWVGLAPQWVGLAPKWLNLCPLRPTHGCSPAQSREIHRLGPNEFI